MPLLLPPVPPLPLALLLLPEEEVMRHFSSGITPAEVACWKNIG
jgi:hypothetical protein